MRQTILALRVAACFLLLSGCALMPTEKTEPESTEHLYDGKPKVLFDAEKKAESSDEAMRLGDQALQVGDTDRALYHYISAYELDPEQHLALNQVGIIHSQKGSIVRADLAFNMALKIEPDDADTLMHLGLIKLRARQHAQAQEYLRKAIAQNDQLWQAHNGLGVLADLGHNFELARHYYETALLLNPTSPVLLNNFGYSKYLAGDWGGAEKQYTRALDEDIRYAQAWRNLGLIYVRRGAYVDALAALEKVMERPNAYERVGALALMEGKYDIAEYFLNMAIDLSPAYYKDAYDELEKLVALRSRARGNEIGLVQAPGPDDGIGFPTRDLQQTGSQEHELYNADHTLRITP